MATFRSGTARDVAIRFWARVVFCMGAAAFVLLSASLPRSATAQEDHSGLTREAYRRKCLMCHSRAAPEGIAPEILAGLHPEPGLRPADAMPTLTCWRRCTSCWGPDPKAPVNAK